MQFCKRCEIVNLGEQRGSLVHSSVIKRCNIERIMPHERVAAMMHEIAVGAAAGIETGMRVGRHLDDIVKGNVACRKRIERAQQPGFVFLDNILRHIGMSHHDARVDSGICASCPHYRSRPSEHFAQSLLDTLLHGHRARLHLPAVICRAVIAEFYEISLHTFLRGSQL